MSISRLGHQLAVSGVSFSVDIDTRMNLKNRRETILARSLSNRDTVNLAYVMSDEVTPDTCLSLCDRSTSLVQNRIPDDIGYIIVEAGSFTTGYEQFLVTDIFTTATATAPSVPLFYKHTLKYFNSDLGDFSSRELLSIAFCDHLFSSVDVTEYSLSTSLGCLYHNIQNSYDAENGVVDVTFVVYSVRITDAITGIATTHSYRELINSLPIFVPATADDVDEWCSLITGHKVFLLSTVPGSDAYEVLLPGISTYAYQELSSSRLRVGMPFADKTSAPWYLRIQNGSLIVSRQTSLTDTDNFRYSIPEFSSQLFYPYPPYKYYVDQEASIISSTLVQCPAKVVDSPDAGMYLTVIVKGKTGEVTAAYTNDTSKIGEAYSSSLDYEDGILSIDSNAGLLELLHAVDYTDSVLVSYYTECDYYELIDVDFNPFSNTDIVNGRVCLYLAPESSKSGSLSKSLYYLEIDNIGRITYCSQAETGPTIDPATLRLRSEDFFPDGTPRHTFWYDVPTTASGYRATASGYFSAYLDEFSFIDKYTVESQITFDNYMTASGVIGGLTGAGELLENMARNPQFLILADVSVGTPAHSETATILDARKRGGGIKDDYLEQALAAQPEVYWFSDVHGATSYPGAMAFLVEVPKSLYDDFGGSFTKEQVRTIVERHIQYGSYPVIRRYGIDPVVTSSASADDEFSIAWPSYGATITYNVYYSRQKDSSFTKHNSLPLADSTLGNAYKVTGLEALTNYYVYVAAIDSAGYENSGPTYCISTTAS